MPTVTIRNADRLQHVAVSRLQLYTAGQLHALIYPFQSWLAKEVRDTADADGSVAHFLGQPGLKRVEQRMHLAGDVELQAGDGDVLQPVGIADGDGGHHGCASGVGLGAPQLRQSVRSADWTVWQCRHSQGHGRRYCRWPLSVFHTGSLRGGLDGGGAGM